MIQGTALPNSFTLSALMAQISHRRTRQIKDISPERLSLLGHPSNVRSTSTKRKKRVLGHSRRLAERATTGEIHISPARQQSRITLQLRQQQCQSPESAWWTSSEFLGQNDGEQNQDEATTKETIRQHWLQRLRPRASHQSSAVNSSETQKRKRVCKV